jgi:hypothetical protein
LVILNRSGHLYGPAPAIKPFHRTDGYDEVASHHEAHMDFPEPLLGRSAILADSIESLFGDARFDDSSRGEAALAMCEVAFEHAASLKLLISVGQFTSGVAMLRLQYEALVRAVWLWHVAKDNHVERLQTPLTIESQQGAKNLPSVKDMLADLSRDGPPGAGRILTRFRDRLWDGLNSFVHGGIHPLQRKSHGYPTTLLEDLIKNSNAVSFLTATVMAELAYDAEIASRLVVLSTEFGDCVPAPEPFPES